jgi:hypothetical protein
MYWDESITKQHLLTGGPNGGRCISPSMAPFLPQLKVLVACPCSRMVTTHAKIVDFISIGGAGAIGYALNRYPMR